MASNTLKKTMFQWLPVAVIGGLLIVSLILLHLVTQNAEYSGRYLNALIYLNGFILLLLSAVILINLIRVIYQWHTRQAGSRFTLRLMSGFLFLTLLPVVIVAVFSMNFLGKNINRQFEGRIEHALDNALDLSQMSLQTRSRIQLQQLSLLAEQLPDKNKLEMAAMIDNWRTKSGALEVVLLSKNLSYVTNSVDNIGGLIPLFSSGDLVNRLEGRRSHYQIETAGEKDMYRMFSRVAIRVTYGIENQQGILTALFQFSELERSLSQNVSEVWTDYKQISYNRDLLKQAFRIALLVIVVLTVLFSLWAAFLFSRRLTQPVRDLVEGTLAVASGDLQKKLPVSDRDDFSLLARSFNTMTMRLSHVQDERELARQQLQKEHDYLDVVLEHLSSGVVTLDEQMIIRRVNTSASQILKQPMQRQVGRSLQEVCLELESLQPFLQALQPWLENPEQDWQAEVELLSSGSRKVLICRGANLPQNTKEPQDGYVLVFEDVTDVVQAEHDAAWGEVARRLAHEIKNPLTPIQLSAERLSRKLSRELDEDSRHFLQRMTGTIIQQVDSLKSMVNAFSDYAKAPALMLQPVELNQIITQVVDLYRGNERGVDFEVELADLPVQYLDPHRFRQMLVNLIKNALEAIGHQDGAWIRINSELAVDTVGRKTAVLTIQDSGPGIPEELLPQLFEPYVTSKHKGTGLGLAIVKKIVEEHDGQLSAGNAAAKGAIITITLPIHSDLREAA